MDNNNDRLQSASELFAQEVTLEERLEIIEQLPAEQIRKVSYAVADTLLQAWQTGTTEQRERATNFYKSPKSSRIATQEYLKLFRANRPSAQEAYQRHGSLTPDYE